MSRRMTGISSSSLRRLNPGLEFACSYSTRVLEEDALSLPVLPSSCTIPFYYPVTDSRKEQVYAVCLFLAFHLHLQVSQSVSVKVCLRVLYDDVLFLFRLSSRVNSQQQKPEGKLHFLASLERESM